MKKVILTIVIVFCVITFLVTFSAGTILTIRTIGWTNLADSSRLNDLVQVWRNRLNWLDFNWGPLTAYEIDETKTIPAVALAQVDKIQISGLAEPILVTTSSTDVQARIVGNYHSSQKLDWIVQVNEDQLVIKADYPKFGFGQNNLKVEIAIPAAFSGDVSVKTLSGACKLPDQADYQWRSFVFDGLSGNFSLTQASMQNLTISTLSGNLAVKQIDCPVTVDSLSGDVDLDYQTFYDSQIETMSGDVQITSLSAEPALLDFKTMSGNFNIKGLTFSTESQTKRRITGQINNGSSKVKIIVSTMSGSLDIKKE